MLITPKTTFGKLHPKNTQEVNPGSHKKIDCICDCGKETSAVVKNLFSGNTASCGRCKEIPITIISEKRFGKLVVKPLEGEFIKLERKVDCDCDCGKEKKVMVRDLMSGHTKSCGKCNLITAEEIAGKLYGDLIIEIPQDIKPGSGKKIGWICKCGRKTKAVIKNVMTGNTTSCGMCNLITAEEIAKRKFGRFRMINPIDTLPWATAESDFECDCGNIVTKPICHVVSGLIKSCGKCSEKPQNWYAKNKKALKELKCPVKPEDFPPGGPVLLEIVFKSHDRVKIQCPVCKNEHYSSLHMIKMGSSLTCGCCTYKISNACIAIEQYLKSLNIESKFEFTIDKFNYDIFVPSHNLLIEHNGIKWHASEYSKEKDVRKYKLAIEHKFNFLSIFEDEWKYNQEKVKALLKNKLGVIKSIPLRPSQCDILPIISQEADSFYIQFHYIGKCHPKLSYGVFYNSQLIACISFSHPTRQSKHPWELTRMASDPAFKVHGIWSKLFKKFVAENSPSSVVSFSDNRLFQGAVYEKLGFKFDGNVTPDYYWVKADRRHHKSALRKTKEEKLTGLTETQLRTAQGYEKVWDLGKKRWLYTP